MNAGQKQRNLQNIAPYMGSALLGAWSEPSGGMLL
jgi:hypothetical protein